MLDGFLIGYSAAITIGFFYVVIRKTTTSEKLPRRILWRDVQVGDQVRYINGQTPSATYTITHLEPGTREGWGPKVYSSYAGYWFEPEENFPVLLLKRQVAWWIKLGSES